MKGYARLDNTHFLTKNHVFAIQFVYFAYLCKNNEDKHDKTTNTYDAVLPGSLADMGNGEGG